MRLENITKSPEKYLDEFGFHEIWQETTDASRWVWFRKHLFSVDNLNIVAELKFSLTIEDDPFVSYADNLYYAFDECTIISTEEAIDYKGFLHNGDMNTFRKARLHVSTVSELRAFISSTEKLSKYL